MNKKEYTEQYRRQVAELFDSVCYVCAKKYGKRFSFHHKRYIPKERTYKDFKNNDNNNYQLYILPIIQQRPQDFELLYHKYHYLVEILKKFNPERLAKLFNVTRRSTL